MGCPCVSSRRYSYSVGLHLLLAKGPHDSVLHAIHYSYFIFSNGSSLKLCVPTHAYNMFHFLLYDDGSYLLACLLIAVISKCFNISEASCLDMTSPSICLSENFIPSLPTVSISSKGGAHCADGQGWVTLPQVRRMSMPCIFLWSS